MNNKTMSKEELIKRNELLEKQIKKEREFIIFIKNTLIGINLVTPEDCSKLKIILNNLIKEIEKR